MRTRIILALAFASVLSASAAPRTWKSADGSKSFEGEFLAREGTKITLQPVGAKEITFDISKLHADDQKWINLYHPTDTSKKVNAPESTGVFDDLEFGDDRQKVYEKLKKSQIVEPVGKETIFGNTATDAAFRTREKIGELYSFLYFTWSDTGGLSEITLQSETLGAISYDDSLKICWDNAIDLLTALHGQPVQSAPLPSRSEIAESAILCSHIWKLEKGGTVILGTSRTSGKYAVVIRFSKKTVEEIQRTNRPIGP